MAERTERPERPMRGGRKGHRKVCQFCVDKVDYIDYKDVARLRRIAWFALIGIRSQDALGLPPYIRILAMNRRGREILSVANPSLPILTRPAQLENMDERSRKMFQLESIATDLHALGMPNPLPCSSDYTQKLIVKE